MNSPKSDIIVKPKIDATRNIIYLGPVYERDALAQIRFGADLFIHGHSVGGADPVLIEAISFGRPILVFGSIFNREVLSKNAKYFLNPLGLLAALDQSEVKPTSPKMVGGCYTWPTVSSQYFDLIEKASKRVHFKNE